MTNIKITVGIDVSQDWVDVYVHPAANARQFSNDKLGMMQLVSWLKSYDPDVIICEATGGLERLLLKSLKQHKLVCHAINPNRISGFRQAYGSMTKTDLMDAKLMALFAERMDISTKIELSESEQELKDLNTRRRQLVTLTVQEQNRLNRCHNKDSHKSIERVIALLKEECADIENKMLAVVKQDTNLQRTIDILVSIPGISTITALILMSEMPELGKLDDKKIASLAGLAPHQNQSGLKVGRAYIRGGRKNVRSALYMGTLSAKRYNPPIKRFYDRLIENDKPKMVALIASMRKLIIQANTLLKENRKWENKMA